MLGVGYTIVLVAPLSTSLIWKRWFSRRAFLGLSSRKVSRFSKVTITIVKLSKERSIAAYLMIASAIVPLTSWTVFWVTDIYLTSLDFIEFTESQQASRHC